MADQNTLSVELGDRSYPVVIGRGLLDGFDMVPYLSGQDCLIVSNETVAPLYMDRVAALLQGCKSLPSCLPTADLPAPSGIITTHNITITD